MQWPAKKIYSIIFNPQNSISTVHDKFSIETIEKNTSPSPFPTASLVTNINAYINTQTPKAMTYSSPFHIA